MRSLGFLLLLSVTSSLCEVDLEGPGHVASAMDNLAFHTATITDDLNADLRTRTDQTVNSLVGAIQVIVVSALDRLAAPIHEAQRRINASSQCELSWSMPELQRRIDDQLTNCTKGMYRVIDALQSDVGAIAELMQEQVANILNLPTICQIMQSTPLLENSFASSTSCFVQRIADINRQVGDEMNRATATLWRTRQLSQTSAAEARQCSADVVNDVTAYLNRELEGC